VSADVWVQLGEAGTLVIVPVRIGVAVLSDRRQLKRQVFIKFSGRFQRPLGLFPG
jgi:hypothetical protein